MRRPIPKGPWRLVPPALMLTLTAGGLLAPAPPARAEVEAVTIRLEEARCLS